MDVILKDGSRGEQEFSDKDGARTFRHTTSHILAQAVKRLYPDTKLAIGPAIEDGFYYDFEFKEPISSEDFSAIEKEMKKIVKERLPLERFTLSRDEAIAFMKERNEDYKVERRPASGQYQICEGHQAHQPGGSLLERQRAEQDAHQNLWNLLPG